MNDKRDCEALLPLTPLTYHILLAMVDAPVHGYGIIKEVESRTEGAITLEAGTLYAAIKRLREEDQIELASAPRAVDSRRRYYRLTRFGRRVLRGESERLAGLVELARQKKILPQGSA